MYKLHSRGTNSSLPAELEQEIKGKKRQAAGREGEVGGGEEEDKKRKGKDQKSGGKNDGGEEDRLGLDGALATKMKPDKTSEESPDDADLEDLFMISEGYFPLQERLLMREWIMEEQQWKEREHMIRSRRAGLLGNMIVSRLSTAYYRSLGYSFSTPLTHFESSVSAAENSILRLSFGEIKRLAGSLMIPPSDRILSYSPSLSADSQLSLPFVVPLAHPSTALSPSLPFTTIFSSMHRVLYENPNNGAVYQGLAWDAYGIYSFPQHRPYNYMRIVERDVGVEDKRIDENGDEEEESDLDGDEDGESKEEGSHKAISSEFKCLHASYFPPRYHHLVPLLCIKRGRYDPKTVSPCWLDWSLPDLKNELGWKRKGEYLSASNVCYCYVFYFILNMDFLVLF
jgi:hypothetical protein